MCSVAACTKLQELKQGHMQLFINIAVAERKWYEFIRDFCAYLKEFNDLLSFRDTYVECNM